MNKIKNMCEIKSKPKSKNKIAKIRKKERKRKYFSLHAYDTFKQSGQTV